MSSRRLLALFPLLFAAAEITAAPIMPPSKEQIGQWITQLGDRNFATRERAEERLWQAGPLAEEALRKAAADSGDKEVVRRASEVLEKFKWGLYGDTPKKVADLIRDYLAADPPGRLRLAGAFLDEGGPGVRALVKVAAAEDNADTQRQLTARIAAEAGRAVPRLLTEDDYATVELLLEYGLKYQRAAVLHNYVAYLALREKLPERIATLKPLWDKDPDNAEVAELLVYLYRANGDSASARKVAEKSKLANLLAGLLIEQGEWKEAARVFQGDGMAPGEKLGTRASLYRLAGQTREFEATLKELHEYAKTGQDGGERWIVAKALFANGRAREALEVLEEHSAARVEVLLALYRFKEALDATGYDKPRSGPLDPDFELRAARTLHVMGEKDKAHKVLADLAKNIDWTKDSPRWANDLLWTMVRLGQRAEAEKLFQVLQENHAEKVIPTYWWGTFFDDAEVAAFWWKVLRGLKPDEDGAARWKNLTKLLAGEVRGKDLDALFEAAPADVKNEVHCRALAHVAARAGDDDRTARFYRQLLDVSEKPDATLRLGDWWVGKKKWQEAADAYQLAWERDRNQPLPLFLRGWALKQAGQAKDGARLMDQSHWLPLANDRTRETFAQALDRRGHPAEAERERKLLLRTCPIGAFYAGEARRQQALGALERKDYLAAAEGQEQALLRILGPNVSFQDAGANVGVPHYIRRQRAHALILADKFDEAQQEIDACVELMPLSIEMPMELIPALEAKGKAKEAERLFVRTQRLKEQACKKYPNSATVHNSLAWYCAVLRRELDVGLEHANKAVELEPNNPAYRDTRAELLFQKGEKEKAVAEMKKCLEQEPKKVFYQKQLKRMEAGDPKAPLPTEGE